MCLTVITEYPIGFGGDQIRQGTHSSLVQLSIDELVMPSIGHRQQLVGSHLGFRHHFWFGRDHRAHERISVFLAFKSTQYISSLNFVAD